MAYQFDGALVDREEPTFVQFEKEGQHVEGCLIRIERTKVKDKPAFKYVVEDQDGKQFAFLGTHKINVHLSRRDMGHYILVRYEGEVPDSGKNGNLMRNFKVRVSPKPVMQVDKTEITDDDIPF